MKTSLTHKPKRLSDDDTIWNREWRLQHLYKIRTENRGLIIMRFNGIQQKIFSHLQSKGYKRIRDIILKARKEGVTTFYSVFYLDDTLFTPNTHSMIIAHTFGDVQKLFKIVKLAYKHMPNRIELKDGRIWTKPYADTDSSSELAFDSINSSISVGIHGRGGTINNLHISEASKIPENEVEERMASTMEAVPNIEFGSNISIESTANGLGGWYSDLYHDAQLPHAEFKAWFFSWFEKPENKLSPHKGWKPNSNTKKMIKKCRAYYGDDIKLTNEQLFWWETRKARQKSLMEQEHPTVPDDAFLSSDVQIFDGEKLKSINVKTPIANRKGWHIFREPKKGRKYVIGGDPAEGIQGDYTAGSIIDILTLEEVAYFYNNKTKPHDFADKLIFAGKLYNNALIAPERNNHGHTVIDRLKDKYSNIFAERVFDERRNKKTKRLGWQTNTRTRDLIIDRLVEYFDDDIFVPNSQVLKDEMINFITNANGKREARSGKHDDLIIATAIALQVATMPKRSFAAHSL